MTINLSDLRKLSFWEEVVCLDCGAVNRPQDDENGSETGPIPPETCTECGSSLVLCATDALAVFEAITNDEDPEDGGP
jgi:NAD-dependent dihydropyrimidine dehydrogenase PreA subunit